MYLPILFFSLDLVLCFCCLDCKRYKRQAKPNESSTDCTFLYTLVSHFSEIQYKFDHINIMTPVKRETQESPPDVSHERVLWLGETLHQSSRRVTEITEGCFFNGRDTDFRNRNLQTNVSALISCFSGCQ